MEYLKNNWQGLQWTPWVHFQDKQSFHYFPVLPGVYRVKAVGRKELFYIGQTGRTLRERLQSLIRNTLKEEMPFNDPHTAAPSLWAWKDAEKIEYEVSAAPVDLPRQQREGLESCLLWQYRLEKGESTVCNHGRFHPDYFKSSDRSKGRRGGKLPAGEQNFAGGESLKPLELKGIPTEEDWMGLQWQSPQKLHSRSIQKAAAAKGLYKIFSKDELLYIGQSANIKSRLYAHAKKDWNEEHVLYSLSILPDELLPHQLKELENDLLGAYYYQFGTVPKFQYAGK